METDLDKEETMNAIDCTISQLRRLSRVLQMPRSMRCDRSRVQVTKSLWLRLYRMLLCEGFDDRQLSLALARPMRI
jgi:hypothetical protein